MYGATLDEFADSPRYTEVVDGWRSMDDDRGGLTTMLAGLRDAPVATLLRSLTMRPADEPKDFTEALALLPTLSHPEVLSVLQLDNAFLRSLPSGADSAPLALFSALKELHLRGSFDGLAVPLPMLSVFSHCTAPSADALPPLEAHPTLKTFEFGYAAEGAFEGRLADLVTTLPALEHLALEVSLTEAVLDQLLRLPRWKRLKGLSLEHCRVRSADGLQKYVKKHAADFAHLEEFAAPRAEDRKVLPAFRGMRNLVPDGQLATFISAW